MKNLPSVRTYRRQKSSVNPRLRVFQKSSILKDYLILPFFLLLFGLIRLGRFWTDIFQLHEISTFKQVKKQSSCRRFVRHKPGITTKLIHRLGGHIRKISLKQRPGRPRQQSLLKFYRKKLIKLINRLIPKRIRFRIAIITVFFIWISYSLLISKIMIQLPSPNQLSPQNRPLTTQIFDRNNKLLYQFYEGKNRTLVNLEDVPLNLIKATIAIEDRHFFHHPGVDPRGVIRALKTNLSEGRIEGGSTITQQLIKNTLLTSDQTLKRKIKEAILAFWIERIYNKQDILKMYFNEAPYGGPAWGVKAAAETYFGKRVSDLTLAESAYLAGLPAAPSEYSPYSAHPEKGKQRQKEVLARMVEDGYLNQQQADEAAGQELIFKPPLTDIRAPHFVMYVRSLLAGKFGEKAVSQGGLKVTTTLDLDIQEMAEGVVANQVLNLTGLNVTNGAAMVTEAKTGQIVAMVGSKDYFDPKGGNFNVALALRQPGSSIKPVTYTAAFKQGFTPGNVLLDTPTIFPNPWGASYSPVNYDGTFHGAVTIRTALGSSYNVPAVKMLGIVGIPVMLQTARELGLTTFNQPDNYGLSLTLGGGAVKMVEMMGVYGTFATGGVKFRPQPILTVFDAFGNLLEDNRKAEGKPVLTQEVAYLITNILTDNNARTPAFGPNSQLIIPNHTVAVKTGTSDDKRDNWVFGYTPEFVVGAWVGNNDYSKMNPALTSGITGATPIWHEIMANLLSDRPNLSFKKPAGIIEGTVDGHKDLTIAGQTPRTVLGYKKVKQKEKATGKELEVITYSDPFSSFTPDLTKTTQ